MRMIKIFVTMALFCVLVTVTGAVAKDTPSGTLEISSKSVAVGVGFTWGGGSLKFQNKAHEFSVKGLSIIDVGASKINVTGNVYHLNKIEDFSGTYVAASAGLVVGGGAEGTVMKNQNGVVIKMTSTQKGLKVKLAPEGITLELK